MRSLGKVVEIGEVHVIAGRILIETSTAQDDHFHLEH